MAAARSRRCAVDDGRQQQENEERRYFEELVFLKWTQADIDRHRELLAELREMNERAKRMFK
jgi:hypothetical protein